MKTKYDYIAVFDSGVGGLSVLRQLRQTMPGERYVYYGDSANAPYGTRPTDQVRQLTMEAAQMLNQRYPLKAMVVACNTATAAAVDLLRQTYPELIVWALNRPSSWRQTASPAAESASWPPP